MSEVRVGVVGAGTMGAGIAQIAALGGYETTIYELNSEALGAGLEKLHGDLERGAKARDGASQTGTSALIPVISRPMISFWIC